MLILVDHYKLHIDIVIAIVTKKAIQNDRLKNTINQDQIF